jgi:GDPmannose 4,6-dehydratase
MTRAYRFGYDMFSCNGILFNHESPRRGETFVTKKIVRAAVRIKLGLQKYITLGNLSAMRDWGFAGDYMEAIYKIMHHSEPDDFVVATEEYYSVQEFLDTVFKKLNLEIGNHLKTSDKYIRPNEVPELRGDATKAHDILGWKPKIKFDKLVAMMIESAMEEEKNGKITTA